MKNRSDVFIKCFQQHSVRTKYLFQNTGCKQNNYGTITTWRYGGWGWSEGDFWGATQQKYWNKLCWCFPKAFTCHLVFVRCSVDTDTQLLEHRDNSGLCPPLTCMSGLVGSVGDTILLQTGDESEMRCQHHSWKKTLLLLLNHISRDQDEQQWPIILSWTQWLRLSSTDYNHE